MNKKTVVVGSSAKPDRYSNRAVRLLKMGGHDVIALGFVEANIDGVPIETNWVKYEDIDTVSIYLNPERQQKYYDYILSLHPKRIIFNPGAENTELEKLAGEQSIQTLEACTLVLLTTGQY